MVMKTWDEMSLLEQYSCIYSDMHKDAYGFRPVNDISDWNEIRFLAEFDIMRKAIQQSITDDVDISDEEFHKLLEA